MSSFQFSAHRSLPSLLLLFPEATVQWCKLARVGRRRSANEMLWKVMDGLFNRFIFQSTHYRRCIDIIESIWVDEMIKNNSWMIVGHCNFWTVQCYRILVQSSFTWIRLSFIPLLNDEMNAWILFMSALNFLDSLEALPIPFANVLCS